MRDDESIGKVVFTVSTQLAPWSDPEQYVHAVRGVASVITDDEDEQPVAEITLRLVSSTEATNRGVRLFDVCDADSAILEAIYGTLFEPDETPKEELDLELGWNNLLFIEDVNIAREFENTRLRTQLIETSMATLCPDGLIVAIEESLELTIDDWRTLGFKRIAGSPFVFRDQLKVNPYQEPQADGSLVLGPDEGSYVCDSCGEEIVVPVDFSAGGQQEYVEDCPVCCRPNVVHVEIDDDGTVRVWAEPEQDLE